VPRDPSLLAAKLRALVGHQGTATTFPGGAARVDAATRSGWILADDDAARALGPALVWAERHSVDPARLHVIVDDAATAATLARRATQFADPPTIETVTGTTVEPARAAPPLDLERPAPADDMQFARTLKAAGAEPVVEHGVLVGEVNGLEVARVVDGRLEVGVGKHDRHAQTLVHGDRPMGEALAAAVAFVTQHRRRGAEPHPLNRLARERWLRADLIDDHRDHLRPISSPVQRDDLRVNIPAPAVDDGNETVYVCSTGIDLDLVPAAADARLSINADARLVLVVPPKDDHPITRRLAARLTRPAEIVTRALD
jgi:hypothetical protein